MYEEIILSKLKKLAVKVSDGGAAVLQSFNTWKADWTKARAQKIDNLDMSVRGAKGEVLESFQQAGEVLGSGLQAIQTDMAKESTLSAKASQNSVNNILDSNLIKYGSAVKSVQRGTTNVERGSSSSAASVTVQINQVNQEKSIVITSDSTYENSSSSSTGGVFVELINGNSLKITCFRYTMSGTVSWQVIEFY